VERREPILNHDQSESKTENTMNLSFDEFAKRLGAARTRREAIRHIGVGLAAVAVGSLSGKASGAPNLGNSPCAHWCVDNFPPGPARGACISAAAQGSGPCYDCGPAAAADHGPLCDGTCCAAGETCEEGVCVGDNPDPECAGATCETFLPCSDNNPDCVCVTLASGGGLCMPGSTLCSIIGECGVDFSCPPGSACGVDTCCGYPVCLPLDLHDLCVEGLDNGFATAALAWMAGQGPTVGGR
jgi:hypothetical protein